MSTSTDVSPCRWPVWILYCPPVLYFSTLSLGPRVCFTILPVTLAFEAAAPRIFLSSVRTATTSSNVTLPPTFPSRRSTSIVSPGATRYCFPPLRITAYMLPPNPVLQTVSLATRGSFRQRDERKLVWAYCEDNSVILPETRKFRKSCGVNAKSPMASRPALTPERRPSVDGRSGPTLAAARDGRIAAAQRFPVELGAGERSLTVRMAHGMAQVVVVRGVAGYLAQPRPSAFQHARMARPRCRAHSCDGSDLGRLTLSCGCQSAMAMAVFFGKLTSWPRAMKFP